MFALSKKISTTYFIQIKVDEISSERTQFIHLFIFTQRGLLDKQRLNMRTLDRLYNCTCSFLNFLNDTDLKCSILDHANVLLCLWFINRPRKFQTF